MKIFKRVLRVHCPKEYVRRLTSVKIDSGVDIELRISPLDEWSKLYDLFVVSINYKYKLFYDFLNFK